MGESKETAIPETTLLHRIQMLFCNHDWRHVASVSPRRRIVIRVSRCIDCGKLKAQYRRLSGEGKIQ